MPISEGAALRVWPPGALAPNGESVSFHDEVALDRALLGSSDGSHSRAANAPKLRALSGVALELHVPEASAWPVLVVPGLRFEGLQHRLWPERAWRVAPVELARAGRLAAGERASACLARALGSGAPWARERAGVSHFLLPLPPVVRVVRGALAVIQAPAVLVIGGAALDITPVATQSPVAVPAELAESEPAALELATLWRTLDADAVLAAISAPTLTKPYVLPGASTPVTGDALRAATLALLNALDARFAFVPLLEEGVRPRLGLAVRRHAGHADLLVSGSEPARFLEELQPRLQEAPSSAPSARAFAPSSRSPSWRPSVPSAALLAQPPLAALGPVSTKNVPLAAVLHELSHVAETELRVLFLGESGTGKEHLARALHAASPRARGPFVAVNCSAIGEQLIESELFGHRKGAFTGAHGDRAGAFVTAEGGTLLLDELGDAPLRVQLALLRTLETRTVKPVGSDREHRVDVRVLGATSADLRALITAGHFRSDLYFRLAELVVNIPPLRDRPKDLPDLVDSLLRKLNAPSRLSLQALDVLLAHPFPGNVRELENALKRALALSRGATTLEAIHFNQLGPAPRAAPFEFPQAIQSLALAIWAEPQLSQDSGSRYGQRARLRAALLELASRHPLEAWPKSLQTQWLRLFRETWATTEGGRNVREVARELGMDPRRAESERVVMGLVVGVGRRVG